MSNGADRREFEVLVQGYLEGSLTDEDSRRLLGWLRRDALSVQTILDGLRTDCLIRDVVAEAAAQIERAARVTRFMPQDTPRRASISDDAHEVPHPQPKPIHWPRGFALAASVVFLLSLGLWYFGPTMGKPILAGVTGPAVSIERGTEFIPASARFRLEPADVLRTGTNGAVTIAFGKERTTIELLAGSELKLISFARGKNFHLEMGKIEAAVARQRPFQPMVVSTPQAEVRVLGTKFTLFATTNTTRLEVSEGEVRLTRARDGLRVDVPAEHYAMAAANYELAALPGTGSILREYWTNIPGPSFVTLLTTNSNFPDRPSGRQLLARFEAPADWDDNFGDRICGYLIPSQTGDHSFWIAGNDSCELWFSRDSSPENKVQIAFTKGTAPREWDKAPSQHAALWLTAGRLYYIEAIRKCGVGDDYLAVAWQLPGGLREVIPGRYLAPFKTKPRKVP